MSEPYFYTDQDKFSHCCNAISLVEIIDDLGLCAECKEWANFNKEDENGILV